MIRIGAPVRRWGCGRGCFSVFRRLAILVLLTLHITLPYKPVIQFLLLLVVTFHAALGIRVILLDFNLVSIKYRSRLVWGLLACGIAIMIFVWRSIY